MRGAFKSLACILSSDSDKNFGAFPGQVIVLTSNMVARGGSLDSMDTLPERESFVTIAPGALNMDALGSLAYSSSALDPKFVSKTISLRCV